MRRFNMMGALLARQAAESLPDDRKNLYMFLGGMLGSQLKDALPGMLMAQKEAVELKNEALRAELAKCVCQLEEADLKSAFAGWLVEQDGAHLRELYATNDSSGTPSGSAAAVADLVCSFLTQYFESEGWVVVKSEAGPLSPLLSKLSAPVGSSSGQAA